MRHEFPISVKRAALARSGGICEATGERYGLPAGVRCQRAIATGAVQFDHWPRGAHDPHPETRTAGNCVVCCPRCNQYANNKFDTPREAKMKRLDKKRGRLPLDIERPPKKPGKIKSRGFKQGHRPIPARPFPRRQ